MPPGLKQDEWTIVTAQDRALVLEALDNVLQSPVFSSSRRYPAMLRYITEKTIDGHPDELKERTIGIEVFHRSADYETHEDPVVRISAGEIRKRLAQFYRDSASENEVEFRLPAGTYVPQILKRKDDTATVEIAAAVSTPLASPAPVRDAIRSPSRRHLIWGIAAIVLVLLAGVVAAVRISARRDAGDPVERVWRPLLEDPNPVLISTGRPVNPALMGAEPPDITIQDHFWRPEFRISITAAEAVANVAGLLQIHKKPFRIHDSESNILSDLHKRPVVLVNANDNKWTLQLMKSFRFQFASGPEHGVSYIRDSKRPEMRSWSVNFQQPFHQQTMDYAIVSRFMSTTTDGPVIVIAGISSNGTEAGGEFMVDPDKLKELLRQAPANWSGENFEAVIKVEVVDGNTGNSSVVASEFW